MKYSQLSRYGAVAKSYPFGLGKIFFLVSSSNSNIGNLQDQFRADEDGVVRVVTSWASIVSTVKAGNGDTVIVDVNYTTAPTSNQLATLEASGANIIWSGIRIGQDGVYHSYEPAASLPQSVASNIFVITGGKVKILEIIGEVTTAIQNQANNTKLQSIQTAPSTTTDICAVASTANLAIGTLLSMDGTFADAMVVSAGAHVGQAASFIQPIGSIKLNCAASNTGATKWMVKWVPLEPGALVLPA
jgi:hypothetical protein